MKILGTLDFIVPSIKEQERFDEFVKQVDKSKLFALRLFFGIEKVLMLLRYKGVIVYEKCFL